MALRLMLEAELLGLLDYPFLVGKLDPAAECFQSGGGFA
jgi:hypothetical protein